MIATSYFTTRHLPSPRASHNGTGPLTGEEQGIAYRPGLDHDRASSMGGARSDVTRGLWISLPHRRISYLTRRRHAHLPKIAEGGASSVTVVPAKEGQPPSIRSEEHSLNSSH